MRQGGILVRFALVGTAVAGLYVGFFLGFLALGMAQSLANALAFLLAVSLQYAGQAAFTFRKKLGDPKQFLRFIVMIGFGFLTSALITSLVGPHFGLPDWLSAVLVAVILPVQNYCIMTLWVFSSRHSQVDNLS